jgi:hypothetical protein
MVSATHLILVLVVLAAFAGLLALVFRPTARSGARMLRNWGVAEPTAEQSEVGRTYLRQRRVLYLVTLVLSPAAATPVIMLLGRTYLPDIGWFLGALLLAELIAMLRPVRGQVRSATLTPRRVGDVLPWWMTGVHLLTVALAVAAVIVLYAQQGDQPGVAPAWVLVAEVVLSGVAVYTVAWLAVARPAMGDVAVDRALRLRSARVMIALGTMFAATVLSGILSILGELQRNHTLSALAWGAQLFGLIAWGVMASVFAFWSGWRGTVPARHG